VRFAVTSLALLGMAGIAANAQINEVPLLVGKDIPPGMIAPKKIGMPRTGMYPPIAIRCHLVGEAVLELLVAAGGSVESAKIVKSAGYKVLDDAAVNFANKLRYAPATLNGVAVASRIDFTLEFDTRVPRRPYCDRYPDTFPDKASATPQTNQDTSVSNLGH
jgi:TonB family protein